MNPYDFINNLDKVTDIWYGVVDDYRPNHPVEERYRARLEGACGLRNEYEQESTAERCAGYYHDHRDGWEAGWPLIIVLFESEHGPEVGRFDVERESVPTFTARKRAPTAAPPTPPDYDDLSEEKDRAEIDDEVAADIRRERGGL